MRERETRTAVLLTYLKVSVECWDVAVLWEANRLVKERGGLVELDGERSALIEVNRVETYTNSRP